MIEILLFSSLNNERDAYLWKTNLATSNVESREVPDPLIKLLQFFSYLRSKRGFLIGFVCSFVFFFLTPFQNDLVPFVGRKHGKDEAWVSVRWSGEEPASLLSAVLKELLGQKNILSSHNKWPYKYELLLGASPVLVRSAQKMRKK